MPQHCMPMPPERINARGLLMYGFVWYDVGHDVQVDR